jgi:hypothetical protein
VDRLAQQPEIVGRWNGMADAKMAIQDGKPTLLDDL